MHAARPTALLVLLVAIALSGCDAIRLPDRGGGGAGREDTATETTEGAGGSRTDTRGAGGRDGQLPGEERTVADAARKVLRSVVNVRIRRAAENGSRDGGVGSGVVVRSGGYILTNNHVIEGSGEIFVQIAERELDAEVVGRDPRSDLAVIRVGDDLPPADIGDPDTLEIGDWVVAAGSPFGFDKTVTAGILSAKDRSDVGGGGRAVYANLLQTDAAINPGNSGGALADLDGRVVGINTLIIAPTGRTGVPQSAGIGFAIPIDFAMSIAGQLIEDGEAVHPLIGVQVTSLTPPLAEQLGLDIESGALVRAVTEGSGAAEAGVREGDVIVRAADEDVESSGDLIAAIGSTRVGQTIEVVVVRAGQRRTLKVRVGSDQSP